MLLFLVRVHSAHTHKKKHILPDKGCTGFLFLPSFSRAKLRRFQMISGSRSTSVHSTLWTTNLLLGLSAVSCILALRSLFFLAVDG